MTPLKAGRVYTPEVWAGWLLRQAGAARKWLEGASVFDPTCGGGAFLLAMVEEGRKLRGLAPEQVGELPLNRLYGTDLDGMGLAAFRREFQARYRCSFPDRGLWKTDILTDSFSLRADILAGNPPWVSYTDLPGAYQMKLRPLFVQYGLTGEGRSLLLGGSRVDLAALVVAKTAADNLKPGGEALFFLPLSLFLGGEAHRGFRRYRAGETDYAPFQIYDFAGASVFPGVSTRYAAVLFRRDRRPVYPLDYRICQAAEPDPAEDPSSQPGVWLQGRAQPFLRAGDPLSVHLPKPEGGTGAGGNGFPRILVRRENQPRQGVNTCGRNGLFLMKPDPAGLWQPSDGDLSPVRLPADCLYPLADRSLFPREETPGGGCAGVCEVRGISGELSAKADSEPHPRRYILLLHDPGTGKPLPWDSLEDPALRRYLLSHRESLTSRRGSMIRGLIRRGFWWACLGVGPYSFAPYKVMWQAYGTDQFRAAVVSSYRGMPWQGNQAMHGYIPCWHREQAVRIAGEMNSGSVQAYLEGFRMGGTKSWAQVGRIKPLLQYAEEASQGETPMGSHP